MTVRSIGTVALVGLGNMGLPIATALNSSAVTLRVFDVDESARSRANDSGLDVASSLEDVVTGVDALFLVLPNSTIVDAVVAAMLPALSADAIVIDMSSSDPVDTLRIAANVAARGVQYVDAPVSGGVARAVERSLAIMVGGDNQVVEVVMPLFACVGTARHVGPLGAGHAMKALNNLVSAAHLAMTSRAVLAAEKWGVTRETAVAVLDSSSGQSVSSSVKWPRYVLTRKFDAGFATALMAKDVAIARSTLESANQHSAIADSVLDEWLSAAAWLGAASDHTAIVKWMEAGSP